MIEPDFIGFMAESAVKLPREALDGNVFAVSILLIAFYISIVVVNKLTEYIILFLRSVILLVIVTLALYRFTLMLLEKLGAEGASADTLLLGGVGLLVGLVAVIFSVHAMFRSLSHPGKASEEPKKAPESDDGDVEEKPSEPISTLSALREDKKLGLVIAYLVVAEFGVISSKTISAPDVQVGVGFFIVFLIAALFFISQSYSSMGRGLRHFAVVFILGAVLSVILGHYWGGYSLEELLSETYFVTDSMVAFVTGLAVSLFMGSK